MAEHTCPELNKLPTSALEITWSKLASAKTTPADLPPNSITHGTTCSTAAFIIDCPVATDPVKTIWSISLWAANATPVSWP